MKKKIEKLNKQQKGFAIHSFLQPHAHLNEKDTQVQGRILDSQMGGGGGGGGRGRAQNITKDYTSRALSAKSLIRLRPGSQARVNALEAPIGL